MKAKPKQASISSFFQRRPAKDTGVASLPDEPFESTNGSAVELEDEPTKKRQKTTTSSKKTSLAADLGSQATVKEAEEIPVALQQTTLPDTSEPPEPPKSARRKENYTSRQRIKLYGYNVGSPADAGIGQPDKAQEELHRLFVAKLGRPGSIEAIKRRMGTLTPQETGGEDNDEVEEVDEPEKSGLTDVVKKFAAKGAKKQTPKKKMTPMDAQYVALKQKYMETILIVEVGYKYRIYGYDAATACKEFGWALIPGRMSIDDSNPTDALYDKFATCSFPTQRLHVYVKKLVDRGHKVGVVSQMETAAIKSVGDNRSGPFQREVTAMHTKGTYIEDVQYDVSSKPTEENSFGYILTLCEGPKASSGLTSFGIVALQASTGDVITDEFEDSPMLSELETRLLHIQPCEVLLVGPASPTVKKMLDNLGSKGTRIRLEQVSKPSADDSRTFIQRVCQSNTGDKWIEQNEALTSLGTLTSTCIYSTYEYLKQFKLQHIFDLTGNFSSFTSRSHMLLNANALRSLEVFENQTDYKEKGSLFWIMDHTRTPFGKRLLRKWIGKPLVDRQQIETRLQAVTELTSNYNKPLETLIGIIRKVPDLEKGLIRIHYRRCTRKQLFWVLVSLHRVASAFSSGGGDFKSELLNDLFALLPQFRESLGGFMQHINEEAAKNNLDEDFFIESASEEYSKISQCKVDIEETEVFLQSHLSEVKRQLKMPKLQYTTVAGLTHLIEIRQAEVKKVPQDWIKINGTKAVSRFRTPETTRLLRDLNLHKEKLGVACNQAFDSFISKIAEHYEEYRQLVSALAQLDCLMSLAALATIPGYCRPDFVDSSHINVEKGRHPMVEELLLENYVPNDIDMGTSENRTLVITGPNMGGKSSYVRQVALICIMAQLGSYVPAAKAELGIVDAIFTRMGAYDNMLAGESTFMVELKECSDIMRSATDRSLVILDEIGRGTGTMDGVAIAHSVLAHFVENVQSLTLFVTHYPLLAAFENVYPGKVANCHMSFMEAEGEKSNREKITFLYTLARGVAHRSYGLNVARLADLPSSVLNQAQHKSAELETRLDARRQQRRLIQFVRLLGRAQDGLSISGPLDQDFADAIRDLQFMG